jgi:hypothetical protein
MRLLAPNLSPTGGGVKPGGGEEKNIFASVPNLLRNEKPPYTMKEQSEMVQSGFNALKGYTGLP